MTLSRVEWVRAPNRSGLRPFEGRDKIAPLPLVAAAAPTRSGLVDGEGLEPPTLSV